MNGYETLKARAAEYGLRVPDLLALARQNDPFFCGSPAQEAHGRWFADLFDRFGFSTGVHLRRIHYQLVSQREPILTHNGEPYENTEKCWVYLVAASKYARTLGLVDVRAFVDQRNPDPVIHRWPYEGREPSFGFDDDYFALRLNGISANLWPPALILPKPEVGGYDYTGADQPYLLEVWVEKSTVTDVLEPVCRRLGANLVISAGFQSITAAVALIRRAVQAHRPARVFYISDFDPAGDRMPVAVARQVEYWIDRFGLDAEVGLTPLALIRDQVVAYELPRIPIKESDHRRAGFEQRHGEGAVELDALEALHPGTLADLLAEAAAQYVDPDLPAAAHRAEADAQMIVDQEWSAEIAEEMGQVDELRERVVTVYDRYRDRLATLAAELDKELEPLREEAEEIAEAVREKQADFDPDLPPRAESELEPPAEDDWLFDSRRDYFTQLAAYRGEEVKT